MIEKEAFLKPRLAEREVDVEGVGAIRIRALSRAETLELAGFTENPDAGEVWVVATALVEPSLSEDEARAWRKAAPAGEVDAVLTAIWELSGLGETAKQAKLRFQDGSGPGPGVQRG